MRLQRILPTMFAGLLIMAGVANAQIERWVDDQGRVHYSNLRPVTPSPPESSDPAKEPADADKLIEAVLDVSGAKKQIWQIPAAVQAQVAKRRADMQPEEYVTLARIVTEAFQSEVLYQGVRTAFKIQFHEQHLRAALQLYGSPLIRRISNFEAQASTPEALGQMQEFAAQLRRQPPSAERVTLIRRLDEANGVTELNLEVLIATVRGITLALDAARPEDKRRKREQLEQALSQMKARARPSLNSELMFVQLYAYRSASDDELKQYLEFLESDAGRWFNRTFKEGVLAAMASAADQAGQRMGATPTVAQPPVLEAQKGWALAASAILTQRNGQRHDLLGGSERTVASVREWKRIMSEWWGINSRADLLAALKWLEEGGQRQDFEQLGALVESLSPTQLEELRARAQESQEATHKLQMVEKYYRALGKKSLLGWDYGRYISLCRWGYLVGYLTEGEAWARILPAAQTLQRTFDSWKDLGENYLIGREFWSPHETKKNGPLYHEAYQKLLNDPASPWHRYAWDLDLGPARSDRAKAHLIY